MSEFEFKAPDVEEEATQSPEPTEAATIAAEAEAAAQVVTPEEQAIAEEPQQDAPAEEAAPADKPHPLLDPEYQLSLFRLFNGEWILGQFRIKQSAQQNPFLEYLKVYTFQVGANPQGQRVVQMRPWPAEKGEIELSQIAGKGFTDCPADGADGFSFEEAYVQAISPIARASAQAQQQAAQKAAANLNAQRILTGMSR